MMEEEANSLGDWNKKTADYDMMPIQNGTITYVTLTGLLELDLPNGGTIIPQFPSTFNPKVHYLFKNNKKFRVFDFPYQENAISENCSPWRCLSVAGRKLPVALNKLPNRSLFKHWERWVPGYETPETRIYHDSNSLVPPIVTVFPFQNLAPDLHAVEPKCHYWLLSKEAIPHMGAAHPKKMSFENASFPCFVKAAFGHGSSGNFKASNKDELKRAMEILKSKESREPVITEFIDNIKENICVQFYLFKSGKTHWLGVTTQLFTDDLWVGGCLDLSEQNELKRKYQSVVAPVKDYLHSQGYFGVVGVDILVNDENAFVVDVNPRLNGTTPMLLLAPRMDQLGFTITIFKECLNYNRSSEQVLERIDQINMQGDVRIIAMGIVDVDTTNNDGNKGNRCVAALCTSGTDKEQILKAFNSLSIIAPSL